MLNTFQRKFTNNFLYHFFSVDRGRPQFDLFPHLAAWSQNGEPSSFKIRKKFIIQNASLREIVQENVFFNKIQNRHWLLLPWLIDTLLEMVRRKYWKCQFYTKISESLWEILGLLYKGKFKTWFDRNIHCRWQASSRSLFRQWGSSGKCEQDPWF